MSAPSSREACLARDRDDPLAFARARFRLPDGIIYLDGNSLGALPAATVGALARAVEEDWGRGLIRSWNTADWIGLPERVGARIAALVGAAPTEVIAADSTSVNLHKVLGGQLRLAARETPGRKVVLSERGNFPTDLYIAEGVIAALGMGHELRLVDDVAAAIDETVAAVAVTQVDYRTGRVHDMAALNEAAARAGTRVVWDLSHSAGALPVDLNGTGAELAVGCGYKYLSGGPGAPAFVYVARALQGAIDPPLTGWFGHARPFDFDTGYTPAADIARFQCGTPPVLGMLALEAGVATFDGVDMQAVRVKSLALTSLFWSLMDARCGEFGFRCVAPREERLRGSQLSFAHPEAYAVMQALIERGVIGDFRQPDLLRFGFAPLYVGYADVWDAVAVVREVMQSGAWKAPRYRQRNKVT